MGIVETGHDEAAVEINRRSFWATPFLDLVVRSKVYDLAAFNRNRGPLRHTWNSKIGNVDWLDDLNRRFLVPNCMPLRTLSHLTSEGGADIAINKYRICRLGTQFQGE